MRPSRHCNPLFVLPIVFMLGVPVFAQDQPPTIRPDEEIFRPMVLPDRIVLTWAGDPATTQAVTWRTNTSVKSGTAEIMIADPGTITKGRSKSVTASTAELVTKLWPANYHSATFKNLQPDTVYAYRVGEGGRMSEWLQFRTAKDQPAPFSFIYFGDAQGGLRVLWPRVLRAAFMAAPDARMMAFSGDLVEDGTTERYWGEFFGAGEWLFGMIPIVPTAGNHDYRGAALTTHWRSQFTLPENGPQGLEEYAYYTDFQGMRIISLNTMAKVQEQTAWLDRVLSDNPNRWTVLLFHYTMFPTIKDRDNGGLRKEWKPVFDKYMVDLVLTGHDHTYARSGLENATVYVNSVGGSKMYELVKNPWMKRAAEDTQLFQVIKIDGDKLTFETHTATGSLYDAFELQKQAGMPNKFTDKCPTNVPERTKPRNPQSP